MNINNIRNIGTVNVTPLSRLAPPEPPPGSEYDQSTIGYNWDVDLFVAGEIGGDANTENYISQGFTNDNPTMYGYGVIGGYVGTVTEPMYVMLAKGQENPNDPGADWIAGGMLNPSQVEPGELYYITLTLTEPVENITGEHHIILATDEPYTENPDNGWLWTGISTAPYTKGIASTFDGGSWTPLAPDTSFCTFSGGELIDCNSPSGETNDEICGYPQHGQNPDNKYQCINGIWVDQGYDATCAGSGGGCAQHQTAVECYNANCHWYSKYFWEEPSCHDNAQNAIMDYLPIILAGAGGVIIVSVLAYNALKKPKPKTAHYPPPYYPPPVAKPKKYPQPQYYPPYPPYPYPR